MYRACFVCILFLYYTVEAIPGSRLRDEPFPGYKQYWASPEVSGSLGFANVNTEESPDLDSWLEEPTETAESASKYLHETTNGIGGLHGLVDDFFGEASDPEYADFFDPAYYGDYLNPYQATQQNSVDQWNQYYSSQQIPASYSQQYLAAAARYGQQAQAVNDLYDDPSLATGTDKEDEDDEDLSVGFRNNGLLLAAPNMEEEPSAAVPVGSPAENVNYFDPAYYGTGETVQDFYRAPQQTAGNSGYVYPSMYPDYSAYYNAYLNSNPAQLETANAAQGQYASPNDDPWNQYFKPASYAEQYAAAAAAQGSYAEQYADAAASLGSYAEQYAAAPDSYAQQYTAAAAMQSLYAQQLQAQQTAAAGTYAQQYAAAPSSYAEQYDPNQNLNQYYSAGATMYPQPQAVNDLFQQYASLYNNPTTPVRTEGEEDVEELTIGERKIGLLPAVRHVLPNADKEPSAGIPNKSPAEEVIMPELGFLLDPSPLDLEKEECITSDGEVGECHSAYQCGYTNGEPNGLCHQGLDASAHARVCCIYPSYCGFETNREVTYFKNPDYPGLTNNSGECHFRVNLLEGVCQLRVDFVELSLKPLDQGSCDPENRLTISSGTKRAFTPVKHFCGQIHEDGEDPTRTDLNHVYVHIDDVPLDIVNVEPPNSSPPSVDFRVRVQNYTSRWNIRISQVMCDGAPLQSPSGCSQYYNMPNGTITSLNVADKSYQKDLKMAACIRTDPTACAIKYVIKEMQFGDVKNKKEGKLQLGYGLTCQDYIAFNGMKSGMCGSTANKEVVVPVQGPQGLSVVTDDVSIPRVDEGFRIQYSFLHKCDASTPYFKFPVAK